MKITLARFGIKFLFQDIYIVLKTISASMENFLVSKIRFILFSALSYNEYQIVIPLEDVQEIKKGKSLGQLSNSIEISTKSGEDFHFTGFSDQEDAFKMIQALYQNVALVDEDNKDTGSETSTRTRSLGNPLVK